MSITQKTDGDARTADAGRDVADRPEDDLGAAGAQLSTQPADSLSQVPAMTVFGWLRWMWRQLTSMRVALVLLFLLSLAAIPGSLIPQRSDELKLEAFKAKHPDISPLYDRLGLYHVYSSPWFSAIYILLFVSLAGCIIPRSWQFVGQLRARPPAAPRHLTRLPAYSTWRTDASPEQVAEAARKALRGRRFRTSVTGTSVAAEKGYLREAGNLLFHVALFALLIGFALTSLEKAEGGKLIVEGDGFTNNLTQYDDFAGGTWYGADDLQPFGFSLDSFDQKYATSGADRGTALLFRANIHYWTGTDGKETKGSISVNHPLSIGGEKIYLIGHGYAPDVTVRDGQGNVTYQGPVPFLPSDPNLTSTGVIKAPDAIGKNGKRDQLAFSGFFTPTGDPSLGPVSVFPEPAKPLLWLTAYHGDFGLDSGISQNVYQLDTSHLKQFDIPTKTGINAVAINPGESLDLPGGAGSLTFNGIKTWASFSISHQSGNELALVGGICAILGLMGSLFIQRRRVWVRATPGQGGGTLVELGGLGRSESARIADEIGGIGLQLLPDAPMKTDEPEPGDGGSEDGNDDPEAGDSGSEDAHAADEDDSSAPEDRSGPPDTSHSESPPAAADPPGSGAPGAPEEAVPESPDSPEQQTNDEGARA